GAFRRRELGAGGGGDGGHADARRAAGGGCELPCAGAAKGALRRPPRRPMLAGRPKATECARMRDTSDVVIIGAGHNGLTCAGDLGAAGLSVSVLEKRPRVGGAAVTEEFHPGFRNSVAAYTVSLLNPKVIRDLELHERGLKIVERKVSNFLPLSD